MHPNPKNRDLFGTTVEPAPAPTPAPRPAPVQAPRGIAENGQSDAQAVLVQLLIHRQKLTGGLHAADLAQMTELPIDRVTEALDDLRRKNFISVDDSTGLDLWHCEVKASPDSGRTPKPAAEVETQLVRDFVYGAIEGAGPLGTCISLIAAQCVMPTEQVEHVVASLIGQGLAWRPPRHSVIDAHGKHQPGIVAGHHRGKGFWAAPERETA